MMLQEEDPLWVQEDDGTLLNLPSLSRSHSNSHHDAEIMPWLPPYPPTLHRCFDDSPSSLVTGYGCRGKAYASAVINNAGEEVLLCKDDREMKFNTACVEEPAEDDGMKKKKKKKSAGSEGGGITREGIMMMMMMNSRRESQILDEKDLLPPIDSEASPTKQSQKQHAPNRALIEALLPLPHGGGDEACMIVESSSSALSGRGSCSCMEGGEDLDAHCNINHSLIKDVNPKVADNLDCMARFNGVSDPSRGSGSTTEKSVKEVDRSSKRKISNAVDEFEGQSEPVEEEGVYMERKKTSSRFASSKGTRAAEVHNESERRRRDRINEKMRALQQIIPNANKTDKASMLDEAIAYLRYLQTQVQYLSMNLGPFMMPMGMQFQQNLSMGMGITDFGLGALNPTPHPQQHCLPGYHPNPPLSNATEDLECLQPPTNYNGSGNAMKSYSSSFIPPPHHQQWMQQVPTHAKHPPSVQVNMQQHQMQTPILQQLPLPSLQHVKAQMKQYAGEST